jgi:hypothetical protein
MLPAIQVGVFSQPIVEQILLGFALRGPVSMVKRKREKGGGGREGERDLREPVMMIDLLDQNFGRSKPDLTSAKPHVSKTLQSDVGLFYRVLFAECLRT